MKYNKLSKLQKALEQEAEAKKILCPVDFFQRGIFGGSFRDGLDFEEKLDKLAELYTAKLVGGESRPSTGYDVIDSNGGTIEVKFRTMSEPTSAVSANVASVSKKEVQDKTADRLFYWVYNPTTSEIDLFVVPKSDYLPRGFTVRYSTTQGKYTEAGGAKYRVDPRDYGPDKVYALGLSEAVKAGRKLTVEGISDAEISDFVRRLIGASESGLLRSL